MDDVSNVTELWPQPTPLTVEETKPEAYPVNCLGSLAEGCKAIVEKTQAPEALAGQSVLAAASLSVQGLANVETLAEAKPLSLFCLTIGLSGERKSYCDKLALAPIRAFEQELTDDYEDNRKRFKNTKAIYEKERTAAIAKGEDELKTLGDEPEPPLSPHLLIEEPTIAGLTRQFDEGRPSLGLFTDEGGRFVGSYSMKDDNKIAAVSTLSKAWDGATIDRSRGEGGTQKFPGRRLACHMMTQPEIAQRLLGDPVSRNQGFLPRFLITQPESRIGYRPYVDASQESQQALEGYNRIIGALVRTPMALRHGKRQELDPPVLSLHPEARKRLIHYYNDVEGHQRPNGPLRDISAFASKSAEQVARIAGVLTLVENPQASTVSDHTMHNATLLGNHFLTEAVRLIDEAATSVEIQQAEMLRKWLCDTWTHPAIAIREAMQFGPNCLRDNQTLKALFGLLEENDWIRKLQHGAKINGRHCSTAWQIYGKGV